MKKQLEQRLIAFSSQVINISNHLVDSKASTHLYSQILRSATSSALNYGEAQSAESKKDFFHKISIVLKELRETSVNLNIIKTSKITPEENINMIIQENNELIAIFTKTLQTIRKNQN
ncbi:four helix bundle protein [Bacteroidota bacterium]